MAKRKTSRRKTSRATKARVFKRKPGHGKPYCAVSKSGKWKGCHGSRAAAKSAAGL